MRSLCIACANCAQNKRHIYFKSWLFIKHHPNGNLKNIMAFFCKILFIEGKKVLLNFMSTEKRKVKWRFTFNRLLILVLAILQN